MLLEQGNVDLERDAVLGDEHHDSVVEVGVVDAEDLLEQHGLQRLADLGLGQLEEGRQPLLIGVQTPLLEIETPPIQQLPHQHLILLTPLLTPTLLTHQPGTELIRHIVSKRLVKFPEGVVHLLHLLSKYPHSQVEVAPDS